MHFFAFLSPFLISLLRTVSLYQVTCVPRSNSSYVGKVGIDRVFSAYCLRCLLAFFFFSFFPSFLACTSINYLYTTHPIYFCIHTPPP